jgi:catechol 2,3-dioxygenase-like lactoylglutathione lyase family enzyme
MLDHIALTASDYEPSRDFYREALSPLGYELMIEHDISGSGFGRDGKPSEWSGSCRLCGCRSCDRGSVP